MEIFNSMGNLFLASRIIWRPYIEIKSTWFKEPDVMYWGKLAGLPHPSSFWGYIFDRPDLFELWKINEHTPEVF